MTELLRRTLRRLNDLTTKVFSPSFTSFGRHYLALARRSPRG